MRGYRLFRRDRLGRRVGRVPLRVRERFDCLNVLLFEGLWVRIKGKANEADIMVGVCYRPSSQHEEVKTKMKTRYSISS